MTGLEKITTQIIDDAKANAQKAKAAAEEEASKILASAKLQHKFRRTPRHRRRQLPPTPSQAPRSSSGRLCCPPSSR